MTNRTTLYESIFKSSLEEADKMIWYEFIDRITDKQVDDIYWAINDDPAALAILTENLQRKFWVLRSRNSHLMKQLITQEQEILYKSSKMDA